MSDCHYCIPDQKGRRKVIDSNNFRFQNGSTKKYKSNVMKIRRGRQNKKRYNLSVKSMDYHDGTRDMTRNNGFTFFANINYCPFCGRDLNNTRIAELEESE